MKGLFIYFKLLHHTASTYSQYVWKDLLNIDFCEPIDYFGKSVFEHIIEKRKFFFYNNKGHLTGQCLSPELCFPKIRYSKFVRLFDPEKQIDKNTTSIEKYDYLIIAAFNGYYKYINWIIDNFPNTPVILIQDDSIEEIQYSHPLLQREMLKAVRNSDGFISYQKEMYSLTKIHENSIFIHHPMNPNFKPTLKQNQEKNLICIGVGCWNYDFMNILTGLSVLNKIRNKTKTEINAEFLGVHDYQKNKYEKIFEQEKVKIKEWSKYGNYYNDLKRYSLIFNLNGRAVAGRVSAESAIVGTPVIGNYLADMQEYCWPNLSVQKYDAFRICELSNELLFNEKFRTNQIELAQNRIKDLKNNFENTRKYVKDFIEKIIRK